MKTLRKQTKADILLNMFEKVGDKASVEEVLEKTGMPNYNTLKAFCSYIRKSKHVAEENRIDIRIDSGTCVRVK